MTVLLIHNVRGNKVYKRGSIVSFSKAEEKRLVAVGVAEYFEGDAVVDSQANNDVPVVDNPDGSGFEELTPEQYEELAKKLNAANKEPLLAAAIVVGVELSDEDKKRKDTVIERIIEQGFDEDVLEELSKGE
ncbi:hypothetical protein SFC55_03220 [Niallia taxi]|uniref:hypothetical protein n=1 Tax=Niallia taxi TaxID=2499688 RepID=UPI003982B6B9